jgi:hypothetical protein
MGIPTAILGGKGPLPIARLVMPLLEKQTFTHGG